MNPTHRLLALSFLALLGSLPVKSLAQGMPPVQLLPSTVNAEQDFGFSVDLDADVAVVGAFRDEDGLTIETGAAFVYRYDGVSWAEEAKLVDSDPDHLNWFAWDVAISGDAVLVSERRGDELLPNAGDATIFRYNSSAWVEEAVLTASDGTGDEDFGFAVDIDGDVAAVGGPSKDGVLADEGVVYVYRKTGNQWNEEAILTGSDLSLQSLFGSAISIEGDRMLIGAFNANDSTSNQAGKVYVFDYDGVQWNETAVLQSDHSNNLANLGISVDLEGNWAIAGAHLDNELNSGAGAVFVYHFDGAAWHFHSKLMASDGQGFFLFGVSVALSGNRLLVGAENWAAPGEGSTGKAYLFVYDEMSDQWAESMGLVPAQAGQGDEIGQSVALQGDVMLIGAPEYSGIEDEQGAAYLYGEPTVATSVDEALPAHAMQVSLPYPNPFTRTASLTVTANADQSLHIALFDVLGRRVRTLFDGRSAASGPLSVEIEAGDLPRGVYWIRVESHGAGSLRALTLLK